MHEQITMTADEALEILRERGAMPILEGSLSYTKELRRLCLLSDIAAAIVRPPRRGGG